LGKRFKYLLDKTYLGRKHMAQVFLAQIPEEVRGIMEEVVKSLKGFFEKRNVKFNVVSSSEDGMAYIYFGFSRYVPLSEKEFEDFLGLLNSLGFYNVNEKEKQIANSIRYNAWLVFDEYWNFSKDITIYLKYYVTQLSDIMIYIDELKIVTDTIHYNEEEERVDRGDTYE